MEWHEIVVNGRRTVKFPEKMLPGVVSPVKTSSEQEHDVDAGYAHKIGGIIKQGEWAWLAYGCTLKILSLRNGQTMAMYEFAEAKGYENCSIKCVEEVFPGNAESVFLAVCLQGYHGASGGGTYVALYSVEHSNVLSCMEMSFHVSCASFMPVMACRRSLLQNFDGCLALGSEEGIVVLLDLNMRKILATQEQQMLEGAFVPCHIVDYNLPLTDIHRHFRQAQQDGVHFGLQLEVIDTPCAIQCMLPIDLILGLAIGLEDGRLAFYDLAELQIFYIATPQQQQEMAPLVQMSYLEPSDDPRPCLYIWAMHDNEENLTAVLHTVMYEKRVMERDGSCAFETFQTSAVRLELPLEATKSVAIACQAISKHSTHAEEDANCLCALSWYSVLEGKNKLLVFDLNQWYKEQMPYIMNWQKKPSYLAGYVLSGQQGGLHAYINPSTIAHFNSMQRYEEHFYPVSLSFDCSLLLDNGCRSYNWEGAQNRVINILRASNASIFLEPDAYFQEIISTRLIPQFCELQPNSTFSRKAKYELMLSVALEHNCYSVLRDCAKCWADGSFLGNFGISTGLSLSTLTEWVWKRATDIKTRCNDLCKGLFDYAGYPLDSREQKELGFITRQLKLLSDLLADVLKYGKQNMPENVYLALESKHQSLSMAADYQNVLLWLLSIGLLPEAPPKSSSTISRHTTLVPYPYKQLKELYTNKRAFFAKINDNFVSKKTGSCRLIYIDAFIEHSCKGNVLREYWLENKGDGLYPPTSIESMLRVMLVPEVDFDSKCAILLYFFLDLNMAIDEQTYNNVVSHFIKFPSVFKLSASLIKTVQSFWNLDHGHFLPAVDEFGSPFNNNQNYPQWLLELLIEALLTQNAANLALRILEARPTLISPVLKLKTLLANELISEAFHFARSQNDESLLELFFTCCLCAGKFGVIRDLALSEQEGQLVQRILKRSKSHGAESLHFVYLLQKSKYIEAVSYMDELSKSRGMRSSFGSSASNVDTPNLVLSAFNTTMTPVTQGLTDVYFRIKNKIKLKEADNRSPVPLSCQLIKQNANNLLGGIYHSSALSAHFATYYWGELEHNRRDNSNLLSSNNAPFLRKPQAETHAMDYLEKNAISYPQTYKVTEKRTLSERELHNTSGELERQTAQQNPKKRRRLLGEEITSDFTQLMEVHKPANREHTSDFSFQTAPATATETEQCFLTQPLVNNRAALQHDVDRSAPTTLAASEIHGILKTHTPEPTERFSARREVLTEEEKSLRFDLPSRESEQHGLVRSAITPKRREPLSVAEKSSRFDLTSRDSRQQSSERSETVSARRNLLADEKQSQRFKLQSVEMKEHSQERPEITLTRQELLSDERQNMRFTLPSVESEAPCTERPAADATQKPDDEEEAMEVILELQPAVAQPDFLEIHKVFTRSVSVESSASSASSKAPSDDNFYSPLSSQNVSLANDSGRLTQVPTSACSLQQTASSLSFLSGPQPRKPLARLSAERSEKSLTPEPAAQSEPALAAAESHVEAVEQSAIAHAVSPIKLTESPPVSSGFGSYIWQQPTSSTSDTAVSSSDVSSKHSALRISSVTSLASADLQEFSPSVSSSRVGATQSRFVCDKTHLKLSECSTVIGYLSDLESTVQASKSHRNVATDKDDVSLKTSETEQQMLDTTLGMSTYDFTLLDATVVHPAKSPINAPRSEEPEETVKEAIVEVKQAVELTQAETVELYKDIEAAEEIESHKATPTKVAKNMDPEVTVDETDLYSTALGLQNLESKHEDPVASTCEQIVVISSPSANLHEKEVQDDAVIVLSSSSSDSSASSSLLSSSALPAAESDDEIEVSDDDDEDAEDDDDEVDDELDEEQQLSADEESVDEDAETNDDIEGVSLEDSEESLDEDNVRVVDYDSNDEEDMMPESADEESEVEEMQVEQEHVPRIIEHKITIEPEHEFVGSTEEVVTEARAESKAEQAEPRELLADPLEEATVALKEHTVSVESQAKPADKKTVVIEKQATQIKEKEVIIEEEPAPVEQEAAAMAEKEEREVLIEAQAVPIEDEEVYFEAENVSFRELTTASENKSDPSDVHSDSHTKTVKEAAGMLPLADSGDNTLASLGQAVTHAAVVAHAQTTEVNETLQLSETVPEQLMQANENSQSQEMPIDLKSKTVAGRSDQKPTLEAEAEGINNKTAIDFSVKETIQLAEPSPIEINVAQHVPEGQMSEVEEEIHLHVDDEDTYEENIAEPSKTEVQRMATEINEPAVVELTVEKGVEQISTVKKSLNTSSPKKVQLLPSTTSPTSKEKELQEPQTELITRKRTRSFSRSITADDADIATPTIRRALRDTSVPLVELDIGEGNLLTPRRRNTRGISVPPQTLAEDTDLAVATPRTRRSLRASSLQPKSQLEEEAVAELNTPRRRSRIHSTSISPQEDTSPKASEGRDSTAPSVKWALRSRATELDKSAEDAANSPAFHTRLRIRLNSMDSEQDSSIVGSPQVKRTRRTSMASNVSEQPHTPRRTRRNSITSQPDSTEITHNLRSRSVATVQDEEHETDSAKSTPKRVAAKRRKSTAEKLNTSTSSVEEDAASKAADEQEDTASKKQISSPKAENAAPSSAAYSSARRLTRTQLAMMEKSAALAAGKPTISERHIPKRRSSRSTATTNQDSDDAESISSHISSHISNPAVKRTYATRSSVKDKDEVDDDLASVVSSVGSGRLSKRRSKDKNSPNTTLTAIPEEEPEDQAEAKKRGRPPKRQ